MSLEIYKTETMLAAIELMKPKATFLRDRYFPLAADPYFPTEDVLAEFKDEADRRLAPIVEEKKGGIPVSRGGYKAERFTPPYIAPERPLTIDDLKKKGFGEDLFSNKTPEDRVADVLRRDLTDLDEMISNREEKMAASLLTTNQVSMKVYADDYNASEVDTYTLKMYDGGTDPSAYSLGSGVNWSTSSTRITGDLSAMATMLEERGLLAADVLLSPDVADIVINNEQIQKLLDNRRYEMGQVAPEALPVGATRVCTLIINGKQLNFLSYSLKYYDDVAKANKLFLPSGTVVVTAPGAGQRAYGAVTQIEEGDTEHTTHEGARVPHVTVDRHSSVRTLTLKSRALLLPKQANPWVHAQVLGN